MPPELVFVTGAAVPEVDCDCDFETLLSETTLHAPGPSLGSDITAAFVTGNVTELDGLKLEDFVAVTLLVELEVFGGPVLLDFDSDVDAI